MLSNLIITFWQARQKHLIKYKQGLRDTFQFQGKKCLESSRYDTCKILVMYCDWPGGKLRREEGFGGEGEERLCEQSSEYTFTGGWGSSMSTQVTNLQHQAW